MDTKQSASNLGLPFVGVNCLVVFPTHFNPNNFLLTSNFTPIHVYPRVQLSFLDLAQVNLMSFRVA